MSYADAIDLGRIRRDVSALAALERSSARAGERRSASWIAARMRAAGAAEVTVEPYRYQHSYALAHGLHAAAGLSAAISGGLRGALASVAVALSLDAEVSGTNQWLRALLPKDTGANVVARIPPRGPARATLVIVAHHDAANTGVVWSPRIVAAGARRHLRRRRADPIMAPLAAAALATATGSRRLRAVAMAVNAVALAADINIGRAPTVPGASDNATGVAAMIELVRLLADRPVAGVEVVALACGSEEAGMGGMASFLRSHRAELERRPSFVLGLDTLGAGVAIVCAAEGAISERRYAPEDLTVVDEGAAIAAEPAPERWRIGAWTDPILARHAGLRAVSLLSMGPGYFPHYHHPTDTAENVDFASVERGARIAAGTVEAYARRVRAGHG